MLSIYALIPIVFLIVLLIGLKKPAFIVAPLTLLITSLLAYFLWKQDINLMALSALEGAIYGLWPMGIIILGSITLSNLMIESGAVKDIKSLIGTISNDTRITVVLVAWGLESFLESISGFGSGLALPISILTVMGVSPLKAGVVALLANSVPTAYGGVGIGIIALADASGIPLDEIMRFISWQLFIPSIIVPFIITRVIAGSWQKVREVFLVPLCAGLGQAIGMALPFDASLVAICSGALNIGGGILATNVFYPHLRTKQTVDIKKAFITLAPFLIAIGLILITGPLFPIINQWVSAFKTELVIYPGAKALVIRWVADAGVLLLLSGFIGALIQGLSFDKIGTTFVKTLVQLQKTLIVLVSILAMSKIMTHSGMIDSLSQGFAQYLGSLYPLFAPVLGMIGVLVTGSVASSGILMGSLQAEMGRALQISPAWLVAMNASGATAGKMLAPHSVAIVMAAIGSSDEESNITLIIFKFLLGYVAVLMIISMLGYLLGI